MREFGCGESASSRHLIDERARRGRGCEVVVFDRRGEVVARIGCHEPVGSLLSIQVAEGGVA